MDPSLFDASGATGAGQGGSETNNPANQPTRGNQDLGLGAGGSTTDEQGRRGGTGSGDGIGGGGDPDAAAEEQRVAAAQDEVREILLREVVALLLPE